MLSNLRKLVALILRGAYLFAVAAILLSASFAFAQTNILPNIFTDFESFEAATGPLTEIDFEGLEPDSSLPHTLILNGVSFTSDFEMMAGFCSAPTCTPDPDNPLGGNIVLALSTGSTIDFPAGTGGAMLVIEGLGDVPYAIRVSDFGGGAIMASGQGVLFGTEFLGFTSPNSIQRIEILSTGPTPECPQSPCGPLTLAAIFVELDDPDVGTYIWSDPVNDMVSSSGDIRYGSATIFDGVADLRLQFQAPPFATDEPQQITWCLDTDQNPITGNACDLLGADQSFTLSGGPHAISGDDFSFSGLLASLDPCTVGSFNWETNVLRVIFPATLLSGNGDFNYAVRSTLGSATEQAPDSIDFGSPTGFFTSRATALAFNGTPLCSFKEDTSITISPQEAGYARFFPELGVRDASPNSGIQSTYFKTTTDNREFRRGLFEFDLPEIQKPIVNAMLIYQDDLRAPSTSSRPTVVHDLSYYQPADLNIDVADYDRPATFVGQVETDENWPQQAFSVGVTDLARQFQNNTLGFRIKLAVDPDYSAIDNFGWAFGELNFRPPYILVQFVDAQTTVSPTVHSTLVYTDTQGHVTRILVPAHAVTRTTELLYTNQAESAADSTPSTSMKLRAAALPALNLTMLGRPFTLDGYRDGTFTSSAVIQKPMTVTVHYVGDELLGVNENTLTLHYWSGSGWTHAACGSYERHPGENWLAVPVCHLATFALFGEVEAQTSVNVEKQVIPQGLVNYGDELTYTLVISAAPGTQVGLYDRLEGTDFSHFILQPGGIIHTNGIVTGTLTISPTSHLTVSFVVQVDVPGTAGGTVTVTNRACVYLPPGTLNACIWSNEATNPAFRPYRIYLPVVMRNY